MWYILYDMRMILRPAAVLLLLFSLFSCSSPVAPSVDTDVLTYSVDSSDRSLTADITYINELNEVVKLENEALPWSIDIVVDENFIGDICLDAGISESKVFTHFLSGTADAAVTPQKLEDSDSDFISSGVVEGDIIYIDPAGALDYSIVTAVDDANTLSLNLDKFSGSEDFYIYHVNTLNISIELNNEVVESKTAESERSLNCKILTILE